MNPIDSFNLVIKNMKEKKARVFLTIAGIIIGIFTFTFFIFVSQGLQNAIYEQFSSLGTNILAVTPASQAMGAPTGEGLTDTHLSKIKQVVREHIYIAPAIFYNAKFEYAGVKADATTLSYPDEYLSDVISDINIEVIEGRRLRPNDKSSITLGYKIAKEGFEDKEIKVGNSLKVGDKSFRVVGIAKEQGDLMIDTSIIMNFEDIKEISQQETYSMIRIKFQEGADLDYYIEAIEKKLNPNGDEKNIEVTSPMAIMEQLNQIIGLLSAIIGFISAIALVVGGINVMNTMYSSVIERTNEISVMKAMGATNQDIRNLFLIESSILGFIGGLIGFSLSFGLAKLLSFIIINYFNYNVPVYFGTILFIEILLTTIIITTLFGTYPAIRAAMVNPADNLRDE